MEGLETDRISEITDWPENAEYLKFRTICLFLALIWIELRYPWRIIRLKMFLALLEKGKVALMFFF